MFDPPLSVDYEEVSSFISSPYYYSSDAAALSSSHARGTGRFHNKSTGHLHRVLSEFFISITILNNCMVPAPHSTILHCLAAVPYYIT